MQHKPNHNNAKPINIGRNNTRWTWQPPLRSCSLHVPCHKQLRKEIEKNLYSPDRQLLSSLLTQIKTLEYLTVSEVDSQKSFLDPESLRVTSFRQKSNRPLLNITDSSSSFFLLVDKKWLAIQTKEFIESYSGKAPEEMKKTYY